MAGTSVGATSNLLYWVTTGTPGRNKAEER